MMRRNFKSHPESDRRGRRRSRFEAGSQETFLFMLVADPSLERIMRE